MEILIIIGALFLIKEGLVDKKNHEDSNKKFYADYNAWKIRYL